MRLLAALAIPLLVLIACPSGSAEPYQTVPYNLLPVLGQSWEATVPSVGPAWIEVVVTRGAAGTEMELDGPGACAGVAFTIPVVLPSQPANTTRIDCGDVFPTSLTLSLGVLVGSARGYLILHGVTVA